MEEVRNELLVPEPGPGEDLAEDGLRPRRLGRLRRAGRAEGPPRRDAGGRPPAWPARRPPPLRRPTRSGQDHAGRHRGQRAGRHHARHLRPRLRAGRGRRRRADQARRGRRAVHRRDPPPGPPGGGGPLPGDGGLRARHRAGQGSRRAHAAPRPAALHADRRHNPNGPDHRPAARSIRVRRAPRLLLGR